MTNAIKGSEDRWYCPTCLGGSRWFGAGTHSHCGTVLVKENVLNQDPNKDGTNMMTLTTAQNTFIRLLAQQPANSVRTDALAKVFGSKPGDVALIGLRLRELNLVTSTNDNQQYNLWNLTEYAKAMLAEEKRRAETAVPCGKVKIDQYIIWQPESNLPPRVIHATAAKARSVAKDMAAKHPGKTFHVCGLFEGYKTVKKVKVVEQEINEVVKV